MVYVCSYKFGGYIYDTLSVALRQRVVVTIVYIEYVFKEKCISHYWLFDIL